MRKIVQSKWTYLEIQALADGGSVREIWEKESDLQAKLKHNEDQLNNELMENKRILKHKNNFKKMKKFGVCAFNFFCFYYQLV